ncbi:AAA family ATPase [Paraburkholderia sp. JHI869]|uniref:ATP-binding protein n=1 Tax=Paraburkholderia sp. JHI869 TaxID=3112959 RepID=UPI00317D9FD2
MTIQRIKKLRGYRIFRDFEWGTLPDFGRYNLIYGWNGAGKTSLSTLFRALQRKTTPDAAVVELVVDGQIVTGADFATKALPAIRVFNRDFVDRSVFEMPGQTLPPVFYIGEDSAEKQKKVNELQKEQEDLTVESTAVEKRTTTATGDLNSFCTNQARIIRTLLMGDPRFNNYEAPKFKALMERLSSAEVPPTLLDRAERKRLEGALSGQPMALLPMPSFGNVDFSKLTAAVGEELKKTVVASTIQELVDAPDVAGWVERGLHLHANGETHCHFCKQEIDPTRLGALEAHFNDHFKVQQDRLRKHLASVESLRAQSRTREIPERSALYPHLQVEFDKAIATLRSQSAFIETFLDGLKRAIEAKMSEPFSVLEVQKYLPAFEFESDSTLLKILGIVLTGINAVGTASGLTAVATIVRLVQAHNEYTDNFERSAKAARSQLEIDEGAKALPEWSTRNKELGDLADAKKQVQDKLNPISGQIAELKRQIRQHLKPATELNREMAAYLGRDELRFEPKDNGYTIMRGSQPAMHLSDGERTAIAFIYFLKTLRDADFDTNKGIVVIDDPVSSLDANSLYCAFGYMRDRTKDAAQIFVLTHNFGFFRQVKNWFNFAGGLRNRPYDPVQSKNAHFYMLAMRILDGQRNAYLRTLDPLLHEYESEYHYLFRCVKEGSEAASPQSLAEVYGLPNIARRLLESFLAFRVPGKAGNLAQQMEELAGDPAAKARIVRFLHTHSHMEQISEPEHDLSVLSEAPSVLSDLLALIEANDKPHYEAMAKIV